MEMETENKENQLVPTFEKVALNTAIASPAICRTPLQSVNNLTVNRSTKKALYSQITPVVKTPGRKAARACQSLLVYQDKEQPNTEEVLLNSLVCKKVDEVIAKAKLQYENQIAEKEKTIADLQSMVDNVEVTVDNGKQDDGRENTSLTETKSLGTQIGPGETNIFGTQTDLVETINSETQIDPIETNNCETQIDHVETNSSWTQIGPIETNNSGTQFEPVETNSLGTQIDPVETNTLGTQIEAVETNTLGIQIEAVETNTLGTQFEPIETNSCETQADGSPCLRCEQMDNDILEKQVSLYVNSIVTKCTADLQCEQIAGFINQTTDADRDHQLVTANTVIQELRTELDQYTGLTESVVLAETLQVKIQERVEENYHKLRAAADRLAYLQAQTEQQASDMKEKMEANDLQMKRCQHEKMEVLEKYESMEKMLEMSRDSLAQMEALYKTTSAELTITKSQIQVNSSEVISLTKAYEDSEAGLKEMQSRYAVDTEKLTEEKNLLTSQLEQMEVTLNDLRTDMSGVQEKLSATEKEVVSQGETITSLNSQLEQTKENAAVQVELNRGIKSKNEDLLRSIEEKNEDNAKLRQKLSEMESKHRYTEEHSESEMEVLRQRCDSLLTEQALTRQAHINQVRDLEQELARRDCSGQLRTAHGLIQELQTELSEYTELSDSLKMAEILQAKVQEVVTENFLKVKTAADKLLTLKRNIDTEKTEVADQKKVNEDEKIDLEEMKVKLESSQQSMAQFETLYNSTSADLLKSASQVEALTGELHTTKTAYEACQLGKEEVLNKVKEFEEIERSKSEEIQGLQISLKAKEEALECVSKRLTQVETQSKEKEQLITCEKEHLILEVNNLQRMLDSRDEDVEQAEKELYEIREYMTEKLETLDRLKLEAGARNMELDKCQKENVELRDNCAVMQSSIQEFKATVQSSAYELSETKGHASRMLHEQAEELRECSQSATALTDKMNTLLQELRRKVGISTQQNAPTNSEVCKENTAVEEPRENNKNKRTCKARKSFLSEIFLAASKKETGFVSPLREEYGNGSDEVGEESPESDQNISGIYPLQSSTEVSPATVSRNKLGSSKSSAFAPVRTGQSLIVPQTGPLGSVSDQDSTDEANNVNQESNTSEPVSQPEETLTQQINTINEYFTEIIRLASIVEKASRLSIDEVNADNGELRQNIQRLQIVEQDVVRKEKEVVRQKEVITTLEQRLENMAENLERFSDQESLIMSQKSELMDLRSKLRALEGEKQVLKDQVKEAVGRMSEKSQGEGSSNITEVFSLKMKIQKLRDQLLKKDDYYEELSNKASRRIKVLEENWRRAEAEVYRFDELIEIVEQTLTKRADLVTQHQELKYLQKIIQGQKSLPSERDSASVPLKSIKTAKW